MLCVLMVDGMSVVVNVMLSLYEVTLSMFLLGVGMGTIL